MPQAPAPQSPPPATGTGSSLRQRRPAWLRWSARLTVAFVLYALFGSLLLPQLVKTIAKRQIEHTLNRTTVLDHVRLNPFTFRIEIEGLHIEDPDQESLLSWRKLTVDFEFTSLFHGPWRFAEITLIEPSVRVQINPDYTYNFSDLIAKFSGESDTTAADEPRALPPVWVDLLNIRDAGLRYADLTPSVPFRRAVQPVNLTCNDFNTLAASTNSLTLAGSTDAGEQFSWQGDFRFQPLTITGILDVGGIQITNFAPFYADFIRVIPRGGAISMHAEPTFQLSDTERHLSVMNTQFALQGLHVGLPDNNPNLLELDRLSVNVAYADAWKQQVEVAQVRVDGARARIHRAPNSTVDWQEAAQPPPTNTRPPGTALLVFDVVTRMAALLSGSTNAATARLDDFRVSRSSLSVLDSVPAVPVALDVSDVALQVRDVSNLPDAAPSAVLSLRWQTNGTLEVSTSATLTPPTVVTEIDLQQWDLTALTPYLEGIVNTRLLGAKLSLQGKTRLKGMSGAQPEGTFEGNVSLANLRVFHTLDSADLLRWESFRIDGIHANLHPLEAAVDRIVFSQPELWATLNQDGTLNLLTAANLNQVVVSPTATTSIPVPDADRPSAFLPQPEPDAGRVPDPDTAALPPVQVASVLLTNATVHLTDRMSVPETRIVISSLSGELRELSSTNLPSADFDFSGQIEPAGTFTLGGQLRALQGNEATGVNLTTRGINLTPTDPYAQRFLGYELNRGTISMELSYGVLNRQLVATNHVVVQNLTLGEKVDSPKAFKVPVKLGLAVLEDRQGRIVLTVPVNGSLDDPQFEIRKVILGAFANVFTKVVTSPFSVLGSVFGGKEEDLQRFPFPPGKSEPPIEEQYRIQDLEEILFERPALSFEITGAADPNKDSTALKEQRLLEELSALRTQVIASGSTNFPGDAEAIAPASSVYALLVTEAYARAHGINTAATNTPPPTTETQEVTKPVAERRAAEESASRLRPRRFLRGGERMVALNRDHRQSLATTDATESALVSPDDQETTTAPAGPEESATEPPPVALPPLPTMEAYLLGQITITEQDLLRLANRRAEQLRAGVLASGRVEPDRIRLKKLADRPPSGTEVRIDLQ